MQRNVMDMRACLQEHRSDPLRSKLKKLVPQIGAMFTHLPLARAFEEYDAFFSLSRRRYVPPNFAEIRHILNIAQVRFACAPLCAFPRRVLQEPGPAST